MVIIIVIRLYNIRYIKKIVYLQRILVALSLEILEK